MRADRTGSVQTPVSSLSKTCAAYSELSVQNRQVAGAFEISMIERNMIFQYLLVVEMISCTECCLECLSQWIIFMVAGLEHTILCQGDIWV